MFFDLLLAPLTAPITGIAWIGNKILEQASTALDEKENLGKRLLTLQLAFDMGDISEEEFEAQEEELLLTIQALEDQARAEAASINQPEA
ncbi:MAG TPA: gas vesicle protein GvpG [Coleofasciculaceae cyanobacterium]